MRALRVGSSRGPTLRTARRGARSAWTRHATGLVGPSDVATRIIGRLSPCASAASPRSSLRTRSPKAWLRQRVPTLPLCDAAKYRDLREARKCRYLFGLRHFVCRKCGRLNRVRSEGSRAFPRHVERCRVETLLSPHLFVHVGIARRGRQEEEAAAGGGKPRAQQCAGAQWCRTPEQHLQPSLDVT